LATRRNRATALRVNERIGGILCFLKGLDSIVGASLSPHGAGLFGTDVQTRMSNRTGRSQRLLQRLVPRLDARDDRGSIPRPSQVLAQNRAILLLFAQMLVHLVVKVPNHRNWIQRDFPPPVLRQRRQVGAAPSAGVGLLHPLDDAGSDRCRRGRVGRPPMERLPGDPTPRNDPIVGLTHSTGVDARHIL